jgi:hypothetical protein
MKQKRKTRRSKEQEERRTKELAYLDIQQEAIQVRKIAL